MDTIGAGHLAILLLIPGFMTGVTVRLIIDHHKEMKFLWSNGKSAAFYFIIHLQKG